MDDTGKVVSENYLVANEGIRWGSSDDELLVRIHFIGASFQPIGVTFETLFVFEKMDFS